MSYYVHFIYIYILSCQIGKILNMHNIMYYIYYVTIYIYISLSFGHADVKIISFGDGNQKHSRIFFDQVKSPYRFQDSSVDIHRILNTNLSDYLS